MEFRAGKVKHQTAASCSPLYGIAYFSSTWSTSRAVTLPRRTFAMSSNATSPLLMASNISAMS
ncbi:MAG TPA: hypothetical protein VE621_01010, partial [Bryobacteraceae bacterium]|nr:hypothetical protein [Bryobacteraceae bacterium]